MLPLSEKYAWRIVALIAFLFVLPYLLLGTGAYVRLHDTLEGEWIWLHTLVANNMAYTTDPSLKLMPIMNGLPRGVLPAGLSVNMWLVSIFGTFWSYVLSNILIRILGFGSMYLLLSRYILSQTSQRYIVILLSLTFVVIPVFAPFGLAVMGQPLVVYILLRLHQNQAKLWHYVVLVLFPLTTSFVWFLPVLILLGCYWLWLLFQKQSNWPLFGGLVLLGLSFLAVNYQMFALTFFDKDFVPHRQAYDIYLFDKPSLLNSLVDTLVCLLTTHYHVGTFGPFVILLAVVLLWKSADKGLIKPLFYLILGICVFQGFYPFIEDNLANKVEILKSFRLNRFAIALPMLEIIVFGFCLNLCFKTKAFQKLIGPFVIVQLLMALLINDEFIHNYRQLLGFQKMPSYKEFLAQNQFEQIKKYIGQDPKNYRVLSLGMSPTIAQYNGFYTLDGLQSVYSLDYKREFRKIMASELDKNPEVRAYFDGWGNRCYLFSAELGKEYTAYYQFKGQQQAIENLSFDTKAFSKLGGRYVMSAVEIKNAQSQGLQLEKRFEDSSSAWDVYLYRAEY
jgi:hypothetical protein